jgi:hypothetical protein
LYTKSFESFLNKTYRYNFVKQRSDWLKPDDWYEALDDVVRTLFVVRYLDGVDTLIDNFTQLARSQGLKSKFERKCNDDGYYAAHFYVREHIDIIPPYAAPRGIDMWVELQITTQLQEILRKFLHTIYEKNRMSRTKAEIPWQWRYQDDEFFTNSLGHMLHNIEGFIMDVRRRQDKTNVRRRQE